MKKILRERKDGGVSPCSASEENVGKKKCCHLAVGAATIATVLGTSLLVYNAVKVDKSLDDVPVESNNNTTTEQLTTESAKKENVTSKQTHALTREYKHTTKKIDYIPGMPSSDYKKMKEAPTTTEVAKEE
jgi:cell division septal protein FtsQ